MESLLIETSTMARVEFWLTCENLSMPPMCNERNTNARRTNVASLTTNANTPFIWQKKITNSIVGGAASRVATAGVNTRQYWHIPETLTLLCYTAALEGDFRSRVKAFDRILISGLGDTSRKIVSPRVVRSIG